jgi:hypothetical protein
MLFRRKNNTLTPRCFHTDPSSPPPSPSHRPPSPVTREPSGVRWEPGGDRGGTEWGQVVTQWEPRGKQVGTRWGPGQVGAIGSHSVATWACLTQGDQSRNQVGEWEASGAKRGPHVVPIGPIMSPRGSHVVPTWAPRGAQLVPTWSPRGPHCRHVVPVLVPPGSVPIDSQHGSHTAHAWSRPWVVLWEHLLCDIQALSLSLSH